AGADGAARAHHRRRQAAAATSVLEDAEDEGARRCEARARDLPQLCDTRGVRLRRVAAAHAQRRVPAAPHGRSTVAAVHSAHATPGLRTRARTRAGSSSSCTESAIAPANVSSSWNAPDSFTAWTISRTRR